MIIKHKKIIKNIGYTLFLSYVIILVYFLFFSDHYGRSIASEDYRFNLYLLKEIQRFIRYRSELGFKYVFLNLLGNILIFVPFGFALPIINPGTKKILNILFLCFLLSLTIELTQLLFKVGVFDVDDLVLNTIGGLLGYVFYCVSMKIYNKLC